jgi:hypothetical protein
MTSSVCALSLVQGIIDYETATVYQLMVVARDRGHDPLSSEAIVVVRVEDLNDNAPSVTIRTLGQQQPIAEVQNVNKKLS